ncbi:MAG: hypothetical protein RR420_01090 [Anaerovoracaceae bacterium]
MMIRKMYTLNDGTRIEATTHDPSDTFLDKDKDIVRIKKAIIYVNGSILIQKSDTGKDTAKTDIGIRKKNILSVTKMTIQ